MSTSRNWAAAVFMLGAASGTGCEILVEVDANKVPAPLLPDGSVARDAATDLPLADAPVDVSPETRSDAAFDPDSELDSGTDISAPIDATEVAEVATSD